MAFADGESKGPPLPDGVTVEAVAGPHEEWCPPRKYLRFKPLPRIIRDNLYGRERMLPERPIQSLSRVGPDPRNAFLVDSSFA